QPRLRQLRPISRLRGQGRGLPRRCPGSRRATLLRAGEPLMTDGYSPAFSRNDRGPIANWFWTIDRGLLTAALLLMGLGVALSFASSPAAILADQSITDPFHYSWRMMAFAAMGLVMLLGTSLFSPRGVRRIALAA